MRHKVVLALACGFALAGIVPGQNDVDPEIKKILDRAATAMGGADKLEKYHGVSWKGKGKFRQANIALVLDGESYIRDGNQFRYELYLGENQQTSLVVIITSTMGWVKAGATQPLPEQLSPLRADFYALALSQRPHALRDKAYQLTSIGEVAVEGKTAFGLRVAQKGWPDVTLYFDKETGLAVKSEVRVKDPSTAQEASDEFFLSDYKMFGSLKYYTKAVGKRDGNDYTERDLTEVTWHEQLPDNLFERP